MSSSSDEVRRKMVVDCDTGVDDAVALLMSFQSEKLIDLLAITCVNGNCTVDQAVHNTLIILDIAKRNIPVYRGCSKPLTIHNERGDLIHGEDGLGGVANDYAPCRQNLQPGHAANILVDLVNKYPGEITLVALGPLTNIAMAYRLDENFSSKLQRMVIMGGNTEGKGNKKMASEFNFLVDPEAAQIVVEETMCDSQICGWELCGLNSSFSWDWFDLWVARGSDEKCALLRKILNNFIAKRREKWPDNGFALCDPLAMSVALYPDIVTKSTLQRVTVETAGHNTRGMMVIEWRKGLFPRETKPLEVVLEIDHQRHSKLLGAVMDPF